MSFADVTSGFVPHDDDLLGVRFRSFGNTGGSEVYIGIPDLGDGGNRNEVNLNWSDGDYPFTLVLDRPNDLLRIEIAGQSLEYTNLSAEIDSRTSGGYSLLDLNLLQIDVAQRDEGSTVQVLNAQLNGDDIGSFVPESNGFHTWTVTNECVARPEVATFTGTLRLAGPFGSSQESSRVEIRAGVLESDGLNCVNAPRGPDIFINSLEPENLIELQPQAQ